jgi:hypothetical protein
MRVRNFAFGIAVVAAIAACTASTTAGSSTPSAKLPSEFTLTCGVDGSASVSATAVQARPDGVHFRVVNEYDEPVSVGGMDADRGTTRWTVVEAPGPFKLSCWPFSQHGSGNEPAGPAVQVVDPSGLWVPSKLECPGGSMMGSADDSGATSGKPPPLEAAREAIQGLQPTDTIELAGYPEQENAPVVVIRDDKVIASYGFEESGGQWSVAGGSVCTDMGLRLFG